MGKVITFGIKKGGVGKSCTAFNLAGAIAASGARVAIIDTDTNESILSMNADRNEFRKELKNKNVEESNLPPHFMVVKKSPDETIEDDVERLKEVYDFVLIDTKGTENNAFKEAIGHSDIIYLPTGVSAIDTKELVPTLELIMEQESLIKNALKRAGVSGAESFGIDARILFAKVQATNKDMMREAKEVCRDLLPYASMSGSIIPYVKQIEKNQEFGLTLSDKGTKGFHAKRAVFDILLAEINGERDVAIERQ